MPLEVLAAEREAKGERLFRGDPVATAGGILAELRILVTIMASMGVESPMEHRTGPWISQLAVVHNRHFSCTRTGRVRAGNTACLRERALLGSHPMPNACH